MLYHGDCLEVLKTLPDNCIDSLVTDPPAGISFMGKHWDDDKGGRKQWTAWMTEVMTECMRVMLPGAHGLVWAIPRTSHWTGAALEDAGFEVRDTILHCFGSGFPKSLNINKALEKNGEVCICKNETQFQKNTNMHGMRTPIQSDNKQASSKTENMQLQMQRCNAALEPGTCCSPSKDCTKYEGQERDTTVRTCQSSMEGRSNVQAEQGQLHRSKIHKMSVSVHSDGTQGRLYNGASIGNGDAFESNVIQNRSCSSQGSQHTEQSYIESRVIPNKWTSQACGSCGKKIIAEGLGTALKPAVEIWWLIRKPCSEKTVAANVLKYGVGGLNIDGCRIEAQDQAVLDAAVKRMTGNAVRGNATDNFVSGSKAIIPNSNQGRFPANLIISHNPECEDDQCSLGCAVAMLDEQSGNLGKSQGGNSKNVSNKVYGKYLADLDKKPCGFGDSGGASRFFARFMYCAKTSTSERNAGLEGLPEKITYSEAHATPMRDHRKQVMKQNHHPTVKPQKLMRYLCRLITPPNGIVLDPFMGSGSTGLAAKSEGFKFIGIEKEKEYFDIAEKRIQ